MKKSFALALALLLLIALAACGNNENSGSTTPLTSGDSALDPASEPAVDSLAGEWLNREANLYIAFFEDGWCILARDGRNASSTYTDDGSTLSLAGTDAALSAYSLADGKLTMMVDGTEYVFERPAGNLAVESGDYSAAPSEWSAIASFMEDALGDTIATFEGDQQVYNTDALSFSVPASERCWARVEEVIDKRTKLRLYGSDVKVYIQCFGHCYSDTTTEELLANFAESYPNDESSTATLGGREFACRTKTGYLYAECYVQEAGDAGYTDVVIIVEATDESVSGQSLMNDNILVQSVFNTISLNFAD